MLVSALPISIFPSIQQAQEQGICLRFCGIDCAFSSCMAGAPFASCNSLCGIGVYMRAIGCGIGANLWLGGSPPAAVGKRKGHPRFARRLLNIVSAPCAELNEVPFLFELLPFPCFPNLTHTRTGDRFPKGKRQSGYSCVSFSTYSQFTDNLLLHIGYSPQAQHKVNCPKAAEKPHWGAPPLQPICTLLHRRVNLHFYSPFTASHTKSTAFAVLFGLIDKVNLSFYFSCGSTHKINLHSKFIIHRGVAEPPSFATMHGNSLLCTSDYTRDEKLCP